MSKAFHRFISATYPTFVSSSNQTFSCVLNITQSTEWVDGLNKETVNRLCQKHIQQQDVPLSRIKIRKRIMLDSMENTGAGT